MINISIDEAAAFDMLSILELKKHVAETNYISFLCSMQLQLGIDKVSEIMSSLEYKYLLAANQKIFYLIERINEGDSFDALEVHQANMQRFYHKKELQKKFFNNDLSEQKTI